MSVVINYKAGAFHIPALKGSMSTSDFEHSFLRTSRPSSFFRLSWMDRFPRAVTSKLGLFPVLSTYDCRIAGEEFKLWIAE